MTYSQESRPQPASNILGIESKSIHAARKPLQGKARRESQDSRYALQRRAQRILWNSGEGKRQRHRVTHCGRSIKGDVVNCYRQVDGEGSRFAGVMQCGSGWTCPICSIKVAEARRGELKAALAKQIAAGGRVQLLTLTFPHEFDMPLADLMGKFDKARQKFKNSRTYKRISAQAGRLGNVASLEVTFGRNGWHPHLHELIFSGAGIDGESVKLPDRAEGMSALTGSAYELAAQWCKSLIASGLGSQAQITEMMEHALDLRGGEWAAAYITAFGEEEDWGLSSEVIGTGKDANAGNVTPFGLLRLSVKGEEIRVGGEWVDPAAKFKEFADAFHGKRLLSWSRGLRAHFGMDEEADDAKEKMLESLAPEDFVATLTPEDWRLVLTRDARGELLEYLRADCVCKETGQQDVDDFLESLKRRPEVVRRAWFYQPMQPRPRHV
jgi:hypothetical protein